MPEETGLGPYRAGPTQRVGPTAHAIADMIKRKLELKAQLAIESARIAEAVSQLDEHGAAELAHLLSEHENSLDQDISALRKEAAVRAHEEATARDVRQIAVPLSKTASRILSQEIQRRLANGHCAPLEIPTETAIRRAYGQ